MFSSLSDSAQLSTVDTDNDGDEEEDEGGEADPHDQLLLLRPPEAATISSLSGSHADSNFRNS